MVRKAITVKGYVQGVGFRYRAYNAANMYRVTGWVRNNPDGSVSMEMQGSEEAIDKVFETAGSAFTIHQTPFLAKRGGTVTLVGISTQEEISYNFAQVMDKELTIKSVFRYRNIYPRAIAAIASGAINVKSIASHEFDFDHIQEAYDEAVNNKTDLVKAVIKVK